VTLVPQLESFELLNDLRLQVLFVLSVDEAPIELPK
jgi:hypothetical protein